ncbi:MAG: ABC transporter ATP-binding protein [Microbacteriaceae bacterium]|nr:MAG: ABC transporter ATP-binding protein [Microbacteriaceae bacterium]
MGTSEPAGEEPQRRSLGQLRGLIRYSIGLVWHAARAPFIGLVALQLISAAALAGQVLAVQLTLGAILHVAGSKAGLSPLLIPIGLLALLTAITAAVGSIQTSLSRYVGESVSQSMWQRVLDVSTSVGLRRFESSAFYDRLERVRTNALTRPFVVTNGVLAVIGSVAAGIGLSITIVTLNPLLLPLLLIGGIPMLFTSRRESRLEFRFNVDQTERIRLRTYLTILLTGRDEAKEIRAFGMQRHLRSRFNDLYRRYLHDLAAHVRRRSTLNILGNLGAALVLALTLLALMWLIASGQISVAAAGAALIAIRMLAGQVQTLAGGVQTIFESGLFIDDLEKFVALTPAPPIEGARPPAPKQFETIELSDVSFTYPGRPERALDGVDVRIEAGEVIALVGENGSGKTTLAKIIANLYAPDSGTVTWDGVDVTRYDDAELRERSAVIFQDFVHFALSGIENIGLGRPDDPRDLEAIQSAAGETGADRFLSALPDGYDTPLSRLFTGGHELSGGQWQRVAIARAYYRQAPLVILDEPSASLDPRSEYELFSSLKDTLAGRTALFISHRFSTVRSASRIYVMGAGKVVEQGTHDELMANRGLYAELFQLQANAYLPPSHDGSLPHGL